MTDVTADARPGATPEGGEAVRQDAGWRMILRAFAENKLALAGVILVVAVALFCFIGPFFYHTNQVATNLLLVNEPPGAKHPLGTDNLGYDVLGLLMAGGQSSLEVGLAVALVATVIGVLYGVISGFFGGLADTVLMRFVDIMLAIPVVYLFIDLERPRSVLVVSVHIQGAKCMQHGELTGGGDFEDRAIAVRAAEVSHAIKHTVGTGRQSIARIGSVRVVSIRIHRAEGMQDGVLMRVRVEPIDDAVAILATVGSHPVNGAVRAQSRRGVRLGPQSAREGTCGWSFELVERRELCVLCKRAGRTRCGRQEYHQDGAPVNRLILHKSSSFDFDWDFHFELAEQLSVYSRLLIFWIFRDVYSTLAESCLRKIAPCHAVRLIQPAGRRRCLGTSQEYALSVCRDRNTEQQ